MSRTSRFRLSSAAPLYSGESQRLASIQHASSVLRAASLAPSTGSAYSAAVSQFITYCSSLPAHRHHDPPHRAAALELDRCVEGYISLLYVRYHGRNRQLAVNTVYGIYVQTPELRGLLKRSEQLLKGWIRLAPPVSHPPLTWPLAVLLAATMAGNGLLDCAIATLVGFDALLRVSEMLGIRVGDVSTLSDIRRGLPSSSSHPFSQQLPLPSSSRVCLRLSVTKTGHNQWAELYTDEVGLLLTRWIHGRSAEEYVFGLPVAPSQRPDYYRRALRATCDALGLSSSNFTPHSLRHGGATHAHLQLNQSIEHVMHRGRWRSNDTCRVYIQAGRAALLTQHLPLKVITLAADVTSQWYSVMDTLCFPAAH
jgi:integrase